MTSFEGRIALVTGASGGIGRRIAERLAGAGATVALHYAAHAEPAQELADALGRAAAFEADLADAEAPDRLIDEVEGAFGPIDVLVANHGRTQIARLEQVSAADFDAMLAINLRAPFLLARRALPGMAEDTGMLPGDPGALATMIQVGRLGKPEEVADLAMAVLRNGYMTNQVVSLDGGMHPR